jgi:hypothetical protein
MSGVNGPVLNGLHLPNRDGADLDRREYRVTFPRDITLGLMGARGSFAQHEIDHPIDQLDRKKEDAYLKALKTWRTWVYTAVLPSEPEILRDRNAMATIHIAPFQREMSKAADKSLSSVVRWPIAMVDGFNRIAVELRTAMHTVHALLSSKRYKGRAMVYICDARYFIKLQANLVLEATGANQKGIMNNTWRSPMLNRVLMRLLYGFAHGLQGRKMFAVLVGLGTYEELDAASDGGRRELFVAHLK